MERPLCHTSEPDWFNRSSLSASPQIQLWFDDKRIADSKIVTYRQTMRVEVAIQCCDAEYTRIMGNTWLAGKYGEITLLNMCVFEAQST